MLGLEFTPSTAVVGLVVLALAFLAVRRLVRNGPCDCHKGDGAHGGCSGGCAGCSGCAAADRMAADMQKKAAAEPRR